MYQSAVVGTDPGIALLVDDRLGVAQGLADAGRRPGLLSRGALDGVQVAVGAVQPQRLRPDHHGAGGLVPGDVFPEDLGFAVFLGPGRSASRWCKKIRPAESTAGALEMARPVGPAGLLGERPGQPLDLRRDLCRFGGRCDGPRFRNGRLSDRRRGWRGPWRRGRRRGPWRSAGAFAAGVSGVPAAARAASVAGRAVELPAVPACSRRRREARRNR